jgi:acetolactate synthase-1/2/3 large subunit
LEKHSITESKCFAYSLSETPVATDAFQEVDTYGMSIPITKHNFLVRTISELLEVVPEAFRFALSGRQGPVLVDVPKDVQQARIDLDALPAPGVADPGAAW